MIDWSNSSNNIDNIKNKDKVVVICEQCENKRDQLYQVAKRKNTHICMSCTKSQNKHGKFKTGQIVRHRCVDCGLEKDIRYRPDRFDNWRCHHCAMVQGHKDGKFIITKNTPSEIGKKKLSDIAKERWANPEYRNSMSVKKAASKEKRALISKEIWSDDNRLKSLSASLRNLWLKEEYRNIKTIQSKELWQNESYILKQKEGYDEKVRDRLSASSKARWANDDYKALMAKHRANQPRLSNIQMLLYNFLDDLSIEYHKEGEHTIIGPYVFDCLINKGEKKLLIECQGDYWHTLAKAQVRDRSKFTYIEKYFPEYEIMYIWEHEFYAKDKVLGRLKSKLGIDTKIENYDFRDVKITDDIKAADVNSFLDAYHYIGKGRSGKTFGAYYGDKLIGCVVYSNLIRQNISHQFDGDSIELSRLCIHPNYQKRNFASYFVSKTFKNLDVKNIISYCDTTVGHTGAVYKALGFKLHHEVDPDYWYVDVNGWVMHKKTLYERAKKMCMTESDYAIKFRYLRKYGGKKYCFVKIL